MEDQKVGVTVVTGFLGAGKTTFLDNILAMKSSPMRIAIVQNECATPIGVENELSQVNKAVFVAEIVETQSGCLCCGGRGDFMDVLYKLLEKKSKFDHIVVETTGLASMSFLGMFFQDPVLKKHLYVDSIIALVDAKHAMERLHQGQPKMNDKGYVLVNEAVEQVTLADRVIINKTDLVDSNELAKLEQRIRELNPYLQPQHVITTKYGKVSDGEVATLLKAKAFDLEFLLKNKDPQFLDFRPYRVHDPSVKTIVMMANDPLDRATFEQWLRSTLDNNNIIRSKGVLHLKDDQNRHVFQGVQKLVDVRRHQEWAQNEPRQSKIILIGKDVDPAQILDSFQKQNSCAAFVPITDDSGPRSPPWGTLFLLICTLLMVLPDDESSSVGWKSIVVQYRWWLLSGMLALWAVVPMLMRK